MTTPQSIRTDIYEALFTTPVTVHVQGKKDSLGDTTEESTQEFLCYPYEHRTLVTNNRGDEVVSNCQLYMRGADIVQIDIHSLVDVLSYTESPIITVENYKGRGGADVIGVLYLP